MFVKVKLNAGHPLGTVVAYNADTGCWDIATDNSAMFGAVEETPEQDDTGAWWAVVRFGGVAMALADRDIPAEGGFMRVLNGKVYASSTDYSSGVIAPLPRSEVARTAGDLILVYLR